MRPHRLKLIISLFLVVATLAVYWQVGNHEFVNYDDPSYVTENRHVQAGLTWESIIWAFTTTHRSNWHPLTWLSHMLDCQFFGLNPIGHHFTSVLFHITNAILLFMVLERMTGALWRSAFVAALFALHPLHVESVTWVAERKDVLSTFFWMLAMWGYIRYVERPATSRYLFVLVAFALGLMAKPMLVTLPFVLLLMDYWPLGRFQAKQSGNANMPQGSQSEILPYNKSLGLRLVCEKVPLFVLAALSSVVTFVVQKISGAVVLMDSLPASYRVANALVSYADYIGKMIWPHDMAVFYPYSRMLTAWQVGASLMLLLGISVLAARERHAHPYFVTGWLWYIGTLVPVIGLVQVGAQSMADRYTYVPLIGLFIVISWGIPDIFGRWRYRRIALAISTGVILSAFMMCTYFQVRHWRSSIFLFKHALKVTDRNHLAHYNLGVALTRQGEPMEAIGHFSRAIQVKPDYVKAHYNLGVELAKQGNVNEAISHFSRAIQIKPDYAKAHYNLGVALARQGKPLEAISHFSRTLEINPGHADAHFGLGVVLAGQGKFHKAISHFSEALRIRPDFAEAEKCLRWALKEARKPESGLSLP